MVVLVALDAMNLIHLHMAQDMAEAAEAQQVHIHQTVEQVQAVLVELVAVAEEEIHLIGQDMVQQVQMVQLTQAAEAAVEEQIRMKLIALVLEALESLL